MRAEKDEFIKLHAKKILGTLLSNKKKNVKDVPERTSVSERERHKGKLDNAENKARATEGKSRSKKQGHEPVSDQKSHEYH